MKGNRGNTTEQRGRPNIRRVRLSAETAKHIKERVVSLGLEYNADTAAEWIERLAKFDDAVWIPLDTPSAALAQRLMLHFPECASVEQLVSLAITRLAETTDD
jgi:hypothetical protein